MNTNKYTFYTPISYDYKLALITISSYYDIADEILLGIDRDRLTWSGNPFELGNDFFDAINQMDKNLKIRLIEGDFHSHSTNPCVNDTFERNEIVKQATFDYVIGIDSDEILVNPIEFRTWLDENTPTGDVNCYLYTVFKSFGSKLLVTHPVETTVIGKAKSAPYKKCRQTGNKGVLSPLKLLHYSWGRTAPEIEQKIRNWGHRDDFNHSKLLNLWKSLTLDNYQTAKNFHPLGLREWWQKLTLMDLNEFEMNHNTRTQLEG